MSITAPPRTLADNPSPYVVETPVAVAQGASSTTTTNASDAPHSVQTPAPDALRTQQADQQNLRNLAAQLRGIDTRAHGKPVTPDAVLSGLNNSRLTAHKDSAYAHVQPTAQTLATVITHLGFELPRTVEEVAALAQKLEQKALQHPLGDFGGALTWPIPMAPADQHSLRAFLKSDTTGVPGLPLPPHGNGVLTYLLSGSSVSQSDLQNPTVAVQKLLDSPKARALGQALQDHLQGAATDTSLYDYVLAAIHLGLDPESLKSPERNKIAEWPLHDPDHWGQPPSEVVACLRRHLEKNGRANSKTVKLATHLLLSRVAPQFLIKDIPDSVKIGSMAWFNLTVAAAAIEAERPGTVANMTFAEVMITAGTQGAATAPASAQTAALLDWSVANNILEAKNDALYSQGDINKAQAALTHQQAKLKEVSALLNTPMPNRREIALALLKKTFGENVSFEEPKFSKPSPHALHSPGVKYSMLDITMEGLVMDDRWRIIKHGDNIDLATFKAFTKSPEFNVIKTFEDAFSTAIASHKAVKQLSIVNALTHLPPEDKKNLSYGKLKYYQEKSYKIGTLSDTLFHTSPKIIVTAENNGVVSKYEFDTEKGQIKNLGNLTVPRPPEYIQNEVCKVEEFFPDKELSNRTDGMNALANFMPGGQTVWGIGDDGKRPSLDHTQPSATDAPYMFTHPRAHHIADSIVKALDLDNPAIKKAAMETTYAEKIVEKEKVLTNFFLDLIPFRSAIVNFMDGNYSDGISDVTWDIFGFVTAGIGAAAKAGKALAKGGSALNKALKVSKVMVPPLLKELNPLDGIGDLITGTRKVLYEGVGAARDGLRTLKGTASREGLIGASVHHNVAATGAFQVGGQTVQGSAVLQNGKWYAYNPVNGRPYGKPLAMFTADSVAMAGEMQNFRILGSGLGMSSDITKRGPRLTLDAHGLMNAGDNSALMAVNGSYLSAYELVDLLKAKGVDLSKYTEIRLTMCHSASGGERSFAATLARLTKKPVKGYQGVMQTTGEVEDVARQMFKDGGALQREFIADNIIGQKKRAVKHRMTHLTADNRGVYGPNPDYNPVNFTAEGTVVQRNKPVRPGYIGDKIETGTAPDKFGPSQDVDFDEYDDLT